MFYATNHLVFNVFPPFLRFVQSLLKSEPSVTSVRPSICALEPSRIENITKLDISYRELGSATFDETREVFGALLRVRKLTQLSLWFKKGWCFKPVPLSHGPNSLPNELPGMSEIVQLVHKAEKYGVRDEDGRINVYVGVEVKKVRRRDAQELDRETAA